MSWPFNGFKAAQTGLVDMGDISFYNHTYNPSFNLLEIAPYQQSFSELVLNVTWAQMQGTEGGALTTSAIDSAIAQVNAYNAANGTNLGIKLRVWGGYTAPDWAKNIDGRPSRSPARQRSIRPSTPPTRSVASGRPIISMPGRASNATLQGAASPSADHLFAAATPNSSFHGGAGA